MNAGGRARVFVALPLGEELGARVADAVGRTLDRAHTRVPRPEGLHLTLAFLGDLGRERIADLARALAAELAGVAAPRLVLAATGVFPDAWRARVLWVGVEERAEAGRLAVCRAAVLAALAVAGVGAERAEEPFRAHVTVGRPRSAGSRAPETFLALRLALDWDPSEVVLLESLRGEGANRYVALGRFALTPTE